MKRRHESISVLLCAGLSVLAALYGIGLSYHAVLTPLSSMGDFSLIGGDGWIQDGASMQFPSLSSRGNFLKLKMKGWRPNKQPKAQYEVSVCGNPASVFTDDGKTSQKVYLRGDCEPRTAVFHVLNPIRPSQNDQRPLGSQLKSVRVTSPFGVPIVELSIILSAAAAIFVLSVLVAMLFFRTEKVYLSLLVAPVSFALLQNARYLQYEKLFPLFFLAAGVLAGLLIVPWLDTRKVMWSPVNREKIAPKQGRWSFIAPLAVVAGAAALRLYGIKFGLPQNFHPDEVPKVNAIMRMVASGTLNPEYFLHPSLLLYCTYFMNTVFHWFGMQGDFRTTAFLAGRVVSFAAGTLSVLLLYFAGKRMYGRSAGLWASVLLAVFPLHVTCSRALKEDALLTFFVLWSMLMLLKAVQEDRRRYLLAAIFLAGCSASVKYSGILTVAMVCSAPWLRSGSLRPDMHFFKALCAGIIVAPLAFVLCSPYVILNSRVFLRDFGSEHHHMVRGHNTAVTAWSQYWMYHVKRSIFPGMGFFPAMAAFTGIGILLWRRRKEDLFAIFVLLLFYLPAEWVKAKPAPQPDRYILPCLPVLALVAGEFLTLLYAGRYRIIAVVTSILVVLMPAWRSATLAYDLKRDTRLQAGDWMIANLPHGAPVFLDWKRYSPEFKHKEFDVTYLKRSELLRLLDINYLKASGKDYLVLSSLFYDRYFTDPGSPAAPRVVFRNLFEKLPIVAEFRPKFGMYGFHSPVITIFSLKPEDIARHEAQPRLLCPGYEPYWKRKRHWIFTDFQFLLPEGK